MELRRHQVALLAAVVTLGFGGAQAQTAAQTAAPADPDKAQVEHAADLIGASKPAEAVAVLDALIADQEQRRRGDSRKAYCARTPAEAAIYRAEAARSQTAAIVLPENACYSLFLKGFALIDLNRSDEARLWIERALAMAPSNAHFTGELAEWYKDRKDWPKARALFLQAVERSSVSPENRVVFDKSRGLRGLGYILIEEGKLDEAEALYRQCLELDPKDTRAQRQLDYIAGQRTKAK